MVWFWSSSPHGESQTSSPSTSQLDPPPPPHPQSQSQSQTNSKSTSSPQPPPPSSEIDAFISSLEVSTSPFSTKFQTPLSPPPTTSSKQPATKVTNPLIRKAEPSSNSISEQLLPTTISATQAFDAAFYCQSLGGKFNDLYRFGELKSCGEHWKDFWFALKMRAVGEPAKTEMIRTHYRQKVSKYRVGPSSEDVWKERDKMVEEADAFSYEFPGVEGGDVEWNRREEEYRRKIREKEFGERFG